MTTLFTDDAQHCPACGAANHCAIAQGAEQCWCMQEPIGIKLPAAATSCYCADCLRERSSSDNSPRLRKPAISR